MKKLIVGVLGLVLLCSGRQAYAGSGNYHSDDSVTFKKIIHVLDDIINDDYRRSERVVVYKRRYHPKKVRFYRKWRKVYRRRDHGYKHCYHRRGHYVKTCRLRY